MEVPRPSAGPAQVLNYASRVLLPVFKRAGAAVKILASASGAGALIAALMQTNFAAL